MGESTCGDEKYPSSGLQRCMPTRERGQPRELIDQADTDEHSRIKEETILQKSLWTLTYMEVERRARGVRKAHLSGSSVMALF